MFSADSILGCILGGAIGDAVGGVKERGSLSLSDDTQLTIATCEAILDCSGVHPEAIAASFLRWYRRRAVTGMGSSTLKALRDLDAGAHWALSGARGEMSAGNGAAMRVAPLAFVLDPSASEDRTTIRDVCRITHHNDEAYLGAVAVLTAIRGELNDPDFFQVVASSLPDCRVRDRLLDFSSIPPRADLQSVAEIHGSSGFVAQTVPLALLVAQRMLATELSTVMRDAAAVSEDADTICAIACQVAGAHLGLSKLPANLVSLGPVAAVRPVAERYANTFGSAV